MTIGKGSKVLKVSKVLAARGAPLFAKNEYRLKSAVDALLEVSQSGASTNFKFLVWTEDKKGFTQYPVGRRIEEIEYGYSSKEEAFFTQCVERGDRWRLETATDYASLRDHLRIIDSMLWLLSGNLPLVLLLRQSTIWRRSRQVRRRLFSGSIIGPSIPPISIVYGAICGAVEDFIYCAISPTYFLPR